MLQIEKFEFNPFQENTYILYDETDECIIIDPGCADKSEENAMVEFIQNKHLVVKQLINTHCHIDHVLGNAFVSSKWQLDLEMHKEDLSILLSVANYAHLYGLESYEISPEPKTFLDEGDQILFGNSKLDILFVPGHAPGHLAFVSHKEKFVIGGDVLFNGSIGRTDLPGGSFEILEKSIKEKMYKLDDEFTVYCGHGPETTIGQEKRSNPFVKM